MKIDPAYVNMLVGLALGAIGWLTKVHYDLIQLRRDARESEKRAVEVRNHYDQELAKVHSDISVVRAESQNGVGALKDSLNRLELRIETGLTSIIEQIKTLFRDQGHQ